MVTGIPTRQAILRLAKGAVELTDLENLIVLYGQTGNINKFTTLRRDFATAGYQVTAGKTLYILAARLAILTASGSQAHGMILGYGDTDVGLGAAAGPTNALMPVTGLYSFTGKTPSDTDGYETPMCMKIPASKYVYMATDANVTWGGYANLTLFGYER